MARIGLLGGTFDPPHLGHLTVAADVCKAISLDEIWLVPAASPPHKPDDPITDPHVRLELLRALVEVGLGRVKISDVEIARDGTSYSVDTLRVLTTDFPEHEFYLVMGVDQFVTLSAWKEPEEIGRLATVVVMGREGVVPPKVAPGTGVTGIPVDVTRVDVSSTQVRERVGRGEDVRELVGEGVAGLIERYQLYVGGRV